MVKLNNIIKRDYSDKTIVQRFDTSTNTYKNLKSTMRKKKFVTNKVFKPKE